MIRPHTLDTPGLGDVAASIRVKNRRLAATGGGRLHEPSETGIAVGMGAVEEQLEQQRASNDSGLSHFEAFASHRARTSRLVAELVTDEQQSLCVLGAGNAYDLEVEQLSRRFARLHLVDIDARAVTRARERVTAHWRERLFTHAPIDLSGMFHDLERFGRMQVTPQELAAAPAAGARRIASALPGPFDVVLSSCLLTQLQLTLLGVLGDRHRLFIALRELLSLTHLRTLAALTKPGGHAVLVTDLCEAAVFPQGRPRDDADLPALMAQLVALGHVVHSSHPALIAQTLAADPVLSRAFAAPESSEPWLWQNGPERKFLVYGLTLRRTQ
jgi:hypothetical protein